MKYKFFALRKRNILKIKK